MKALTFWTAILTLGFVCGCSKPEQKALESFKLIVAHLSELKSKKGTATYSDISFNVNKTDSLISPFTGVINLQDEEHNPYTCTFALQDGKWVHKEIEAEIGEPQKPDQQKLAEVYATRGEDGAKNYLKTLELSNGLKRLGLLANKIVLDKELTKFLKSPPVLKDTKLLMDYENSEKALKQVEEKQSSQ